ncbi:MAG: anti-sigma factor antagonist [Chloroflexota bacterium]
MNIAVSTSSQITTIALEGDLDGSSAPQAQQQIVPLAQPGARIVMDMSKVPYMSSAGIRMLLATYRQVTGNGGKIVLAGLVEEVKDTMQVTGFLNFFTAVETAEEGQAALAQ